MFINKKENQKSEVCLVKSKKIERSHVNIRS